MVDNAGWTTERPLGSSLSVVVRTKGHLEAELLAADSPDGNLAWALWRDMCLPAGECISISKESAEGISVNAF